MPPASKPVGSQVGSQSPQETLLRTNTRNTDLNQAQAGRYLLEDDAINAVISVTVTEAGLGAAPVCN